MLANIRRDIAGCQPGECLFSRCGTKGAFSSEGTPSLCYNRPGSQSWPVLGAGFKPVVRYFVSRVGSTPTGFRHPGPGAADHAAAAASAAVVTAASTSSEKLAKDWDRRLSN